MAEGSTKLWTEVVVAILIWIASEFGEEIFSAIVTFLEGAAHG